MTWDVSAGLEGKGVLVTGAARGIGRSVAESFAAAGSRVLAVDRDSARLHSVVARLPGEGHVAVAFDLRDVHGHERLVETAIAKLGRLDVLAHLAGILVRRPDINDVTESEWDDQLDVNLKASFFLARTAAEAMKEARAPGRIILCSSPSWWTGGLPGAIPYAASKGGVISIVRGLAKVYGPAGITVNAIVPGLVNTDMGRAGLTEEVQRSVAEASALGRWAEPHEIAAPVLFLASDHAAFITGATLNVTGGMLVY